MSEEFDETGRIVLMEMQGEARGLSMMTFIKALRGEHPEASLSDAAAVWQKYMGIDGHGQTHYFESGEAIR